MQPIRRKPTPSQILAISSPVQQRFPQRSSSYGVPFLTLKPVEFSLTEGTDIPPPSLHTTPPDSPDDANSPAPSGGPLSSHPVTPIDIDGTDKFKPNGTYSFFPVANANASTNPQQRQPPPKNTDSSIQSTPNHTPHPPGTPDPSHRPYPSLTDSDITPDTPVTPLSTRTRRPSIAQRFLHSLRSRSASSTSRNGHAASTGQAYGSGTGATRHAASKSSSYASLPISSSTYNRTSPATSNATGADATAKRRSRLSMTLSALVAPRGTKRPASSRPASSLGLTSSDGAADGVAGADGAADHGSGGARKKSFDWLSKRRSGLWGRDVDEGATDGREEFERGRDAGENGAHGDGDGHGHGNGPGAATQALNGDVRGAQQAEKPLPRDPPPQIPEVTMVTTKLDGEGMFGDIGRRGTVYQGRNGRRYMYS